MKRERKLTGWHALGIFGGAFGLIIGVNVALAWNAIATFPGLEVANSYVASQEFDARRHAQEALGWTARATAQNGLVILSLNDAQGRPVHAEIVEATLGRATHVKDDFTPAFDFDGKEYVAPAELGRGYWNLRLAVRADDGTLFQQRLQLHVKG